METSEQTALLRYIEFSLISMIKEVDPHIELIVKNRLYALAHNIVRDIEDGIFISDKLNSDPVPPR